MTAKTDVSKAKDGDCPHCGRCSHCGRSDHQVAQPPTYIPYPVPQPYPVYPRPYVPWAPPLYPYTVYTSGTTMTTTPVGAHTSSTYTIDMAGEFHGVYTSGYSQVIS